MKRILVKERPNKGERIRQTDFRSHEIGGEPYWDETAYYGFSLSQIETGLEDPTTELAALCREVAGNVIRSERLLQRLAIPEHAWDTILESWRRDDPSLYGRFDLAYDGAGPAKLLEYNADTPTALFEAAVFQWLWLEDALAQGLVPAGADQFNSIHERLIAQLKEMRSAADCPDRLHLACVRNSAEDLGLIAYLQDCAVQAGFETGVLDIASIGSRGYGPFLDLQGAAITLLFKLYPWEWM